MCAMDVKVNRGRINADAQAPVKKRLTFTFVRDLKEELKKVSWTTQDELKFSTKMVVITTFLLGLSIYLVDLVIKSSLDWIALIVRYIFG